MKLKLEITKDELLGVIGEFIDPIIGEDFDLQKINFKINKEGEFDKVILKLTGKTGAKDFQPVDNKNQ